MRRNVGEAKRFTVFVRFRALSLGNDVIFKLFRKNNKIYGICVVK
jgi:hypothetical protein